MSKELPDHGGSSWAYLFHDAAHRKRLALPRLWPRERADDRDVPVQAVAERGGNVVTVRELIEQLLGEDMESDVCIRVERGDFWGSVLIDGISQHKPSRGTVLLEPDRFLIVDKDGKP